MRETADVPADGAVSANRARIPQPVALAGQQANPVAARQSNSRTLRFCSAGTGSKCLGRSV